MPSVQAPGLMPASATRSGGAPEKDESLWDCSTCQAVE